ncbi:xaa-Pro aminopeptidase ApepP isoform X2 [Leptinotarsa decemlineata]|uniref:xaa-Pro aminopeptidase ApepP isoform X2 n=1 Tax=Leptinotarsa decemlineata TaxID=7539 RepID=UPI003D30AD15
MGNRILIFLCCCTLVLCYSELEREKQRGELRKACSKFGHAVQPIRRVNTTMRLQQLREKMTSEVILGAPAIQAYLVTSSDEHQSTDVDDYEKRREYISGFSGSYGNAIITLDKAALWTDGRYHLQADEQIDCNWLLFREGHKNIPTISDWLRKHMPKDGRIGLNPKLVSEYMWNKLRSELKGSSLELVALNVSLVDLIWPPEERGVKRSKDAFILGIDKAGKNYTIKMNETRRELQKHGADAMVITALDEIAWLLNIRGRDVPNSPFLRSYVILDMHNIFLYVNISQLQDNNVRENLHSDSRIVRSDSVLLKDYDDIWRDLRIKSQLYKHILVPSHCVYSEGASHAIYEHIFADRRLPRQSPIIYLKAVKNYVEIKGMQNANIRDSAAVCDCFAYLEKLMNANEKLMELDIVELLNEYRFEQNGSLGNSFRTVAGYSSNAAHPNYEPTVNTNVQIFKNSTLVLESGGQYFDGTTDVTRTLHFGEPTDEMKEAYTRVLIGMIQLSTLTFPSNMKMAVADALARASLWEVGLDYLHETGNGIGAFLGVQESPIIVHFSSETSFQQVFKPGYFLTNEPGFYREGEFGIRLANVMEVIEKPWLKHGGHTFLGFKVVTFVPFEPKLIKLSLLSHQQRKWLNNYNEQVRQLVGAELKRQNRMDGFYWMMEKTKFIPENGGRELNRIQNFLLTGIFILFFV